MLAAIGTLKVKSETKFALLRNLGSILSCVSPAKRPTLGTPLVGNSGAGVVMTLRMLEA